MFLPDQVWALVGCTCLGVCIIWMGTMGFILLAVPLLVLRKRDALTNTFGFGVLLCGARLHVHMQNEEPCLPMSFKLLS